MQRYKIQIAGQYRDSSRIELITNPFDGSAVAEVAVASERDMGDAIMATHRAFAHTRGLATHMRVTILEGIAQRIREKKSEIARLIARESGKPIRFARGEVDR